jgi:hypothetical protein
VLILADISSKVNDLLLPLVAWQQLIVTREATAFALRTGGMAGMPATFVAK